MLGAWKTHDWCVPLPLPAQRSQAAVLPFRWFGLTLNSPKSQWASGAFPLTVVMCFMKGLCVPERTVLPWILTPFPSPANLVTCTDEVPPTLYPICRQDLREAVSEPPTMAPAWSAASPTPVSRSFSGSAECASSYTNTLVKVFAVPTHYL